MKKQIKIIALILAIVMILASCTPAVPDNGDDAATTESSVTTTQESEETSKESAAESSEGGETTAEEETTEEEETFPDLPSNYYNSSLGMSIDEVKAQLNITDYDFVIADWLLKRFENAALGLEEPPMPEETESETDTDSDTESESSTETETGYVEPTMAYSNNSGEEETTSVPDYEYVDALYQEFEDKYYYVDTQVSLATIVYYYNMADAEASALYLNVYGKFGDLYNAYIEACKNVYTNSPISEELFADWTEEDIEALFGYDPKTQELREEVEALQVELNEMSQNDKNYNDRAAEIYAQIVTKNNEIARIEGYANYYEYASKEIYGRDYGVEELTAFSEYVSKYFNENLTKLYDNYSDSAQQLSSTANNDLRKFMNNAFDKQPLNYLDLYIKSYKTGSTRAGFHHLFENGNFITSNKVKSHPTAFQTYISGEGWDTPICFFGSKGQDTMTVVHEMGHYYAALYNENVNSFDLAETQSQANEMLFLAFVEPYMYGIVYDTIEAYTMYNNIAMTIVCVIIDEYEREVYSLESVEGYTSADFDAIMAKVCEKYGGITYINGNITNINSYWRQVAPNNPVYYISYATSVIAALNIYSVAKEDQEAARKIYHDICEKSTEDDTLLTASKKAGLSNIFDEQTFKDIIDAILAD